MLKPIKDFDGYFISDEGKVYCNLGRGNRRNGNTTSMYELKPRKTKNGYCRVYMRQISTGKRVDRYIHRLVATYFIPNPDNKRYVNHINCMRDDNRVSNLEWCTAKENNAYTLKLNHVRRNELGQYVRAFSYRDCIV